MTTMNNNQDTIEENNMNVLVEKMKEYATKVVEGLRVLQKDKTVRESTALKAFRLMADENVLHLHVPKGMTAKTVEATNRTTFNCHGSIAQRVGLELAMVQIPLGKMEFSKNKALSFVGNDNATLQMLNQVGAVRWNRPAQEGGEWTVSFQPHQFLPKALLEYVTHQVRVVDGQMNIGSPLVTPPAWLLKNRSSGTMNLLLCKNPDNRFYKYLVSNPERHYRWAKDLMNVPIGSTGTSLVVWLPEDGANGDGHMYWTGEESGLVRGLHKFYTGPVAKDDKYCQTKGQLLGGDFGRLMVNMLVRKHARQHLDAVLAALESGKQVIVSRLSNSKYEKDHKDIFDTKFDFVSEEHESDTDKDWSLSAIVLLDSIVSLNEYGTAIKQQLMKMYVDSADKTLTGKPSASAKSMADLVASENPMDVLGADHEWALGLVGNLLKYVKDRIKTSSKSTKVPGHRLAIVCEAELAQSGMMVVNSKEYANIVAAIKETEELFGVEFPKDRCTEIRFPISGAGSVLSTGIAVDERVPDGLAIVSDKAMAHMNGDGDDHITIVADISATTEEAPIVTGRTEIPKVEGKEYAAYMGESIYYQPGLKQGLLGFVFNNMTTEAENARAAMERGDKGEYVAHMGNVEFLKKLLDVVAQSIKKAYKIPMVKLLTIVSDNLTRMNAGKAKTLQDKLARETYLNTSVAGLVIGRFFPDALVQHISKEVHKPAQSVNKLWVSTLHPVSVELSEGKRRFHEANELHREALNKLTNALDGFGEGRCIAQLLAYLQLAGTMAQAMNIEFVAGTFRMYHLASAIELARRFKKAGVISGLEVTEKELVDKVLTHYGENNDAFNARTSGLTAEELKARTAIKAVMRTTLEDGTGITISPKWGEDKVTVRTEAGNQYMSWKAVIEHIGDIPADTKDYLLKWLLFRQQLEQFSASVEANTPVVV